MRRKLLFKLCRIKLLETLEVSNCVLRNCAKRNDIFTSSKLMALMRFAKSLSWAFNLQKIASVERKSRSCKKQNLLAVSIQMLVKLFFI